MQICQLHLADAGRADQKEWTRGGNVSSRTHHQAVDIVEKHSKKVLVQGETGQSDAAKGAPNFGQSTQGNAESPRSSPGPGSSEDNREQAMLEDIARCLQRP